MPAGPEQETTDATTPGSAEVHRSSRCLQGLPPQYSTLASSGRKVFSTTTTQTEHVDGPSAVVPCVVNAPLTPNPFHSDPSDDVEEWLNCFEWVAAMSDWDNRRKLKNVYISLLHEARVWYENHEASFTSWPEFHRLLREAFSNPKRKERDEQAWST